MMLTNTIRSPYFAINLVSYHYQKQLDPPPRSGLQRFSRVSLRLFCGKIGCIPSELTATGDNKSIPRPEELTLNISFLWRLHHV